MAEQRLLDYLRKQRGALTSGPEDVQGGMGDLFRAPPAGAITQPNLPDLALQSRGNAMPQLANPQLGGSMNTPFMGGNLGFEGAYRPTSAQEPPDWNAMLRFKKEF